MTAALKDQLCMGKGKSCRISGMLWAFAACSSSEESVRHLGHCKSSKTTMATGTPFGGLSSEASWAAAKEGSDSKARKNQSAFFICKFDANNAIFMVPKSQARGQAELQKSELTALQGEELLLNR